MAGTEMLRRRYLIGSAHVAPRFRVMSDVPVQPDETDLERRIEQQQLLVARLINECKSTVEANEALYQLCVRLARLRYQKRMYAAEAAVASALPR
jgi:hypothetical protein